MKKLSPRFWVALTIFSFMGQVAWVVENMYFNVFIYNMFSASPSDISLMVAASAVAATLTTVFIGALSDRIGKRKLFISGGYILWGISIFSFVFIREDIIKGLFPYAVSASAVGVSLVIILDCVMTFFGSSANDAAFNAWLTDSTDNTNRGAVEGINSMMPLVAILAVFGGFMFFDLSKEKSWSLIFSIIGILVLIIGVLGLFLIKEPKITPSETGYFYNIFYGFKPSTIIKNPILYLSLVAFSVFNIAIQIFMPYLIIYYEKSLEMANYVLIMAPAIILASVATALWGKVYDKKGFFFSVIISVLSLGSGLFILIFAREMIPVFCGSLLMMCGYLSSMAVFGALIRDNTPENKAGMFQGLRIFSQVLIPGVIGPAIGAFVLRDCEIIPNSDGTTSFLPNEKIFLASLLTLIPLSLVLLFIFKKTPTETVSLKTPFEKDLGDVPFPEYPRPTMKRDSFINLNGKWNLKIIRGKKERFNGLVLVPFPIGSRLSGVDYSPVGKELFIYERPLDLKPQKDKKILLHFGAVDTLARVFINNRLVGTNSGSYIPFSFDITEFLEENAVLRVEVADNLDKNYPYGKQRKNRGGMWYTPISGIWQTVWCEEVPKNYIEKIKITGTESDVNIEVFGGEEEKELYLGDKTYKFSGESFTLKPENLILWTPENPYLYDFQIKSGKDLISSYFALRTIKVSGKDILLNGKPYFFNGLLDQGYYSDGIFLPATEQGFLTDILEMKKLGFNMLRKHIKIEPEIFYYYCDKYGMAVFQDLVNNGPYSFLIDTALPTIGFRRGISHFCSKERKENFYHLMKETFKNLHNHPSVVYYTIFNEGWGQFKADAVYKDVKALVPDRVIDATSGWFQTKKSDVLSEHIYFKPLKLKNDGRPLVLSEFGGYSYKIAEHSFNLKNTYCYKFFNDKEKFNKALSDLYLNEVLPLIKNESLAAAVLTQVSDVEDETNGLLTYDRVVLKVDSEEMIKINERLIKAFNKR